MGGGDPRRTQLLHGALPGASRVGACTSSSGGRCPGAATLYTLRHTFATLWLESDESLKILQEILGHSRIETTLNVYTNVLPHIQTAAMGRFSDAK